MATRLRIMCWNIALGNLDKKAPDNSKLQLIADEINTMSPDLVLLNEVKIKREIWPFQSGYNQALMLSPMIGLPYVHWLHTAATGLTGWKAVAVLSRFPLGPATEHRLKFSIGISTPFSAQISFGWFPTGFATIGTSVTIDGIQHRIFSIRLSPRNQDHTDAENAEGINQTRDLIQSVPKRVPLIFGGDFNREAASSEIANFLTATQLRDVYVEKPDPERCTFYHKDRIDFIFFRGPYKVTDMQQRCPWGAIRNDPQCVALEDELKEVTKESYKKIREEGLIMHPEPSVPGGRKKPLILKPGRYKKLLAPRRELLEKLEALGCRPPAVSDHAWVFAELECIPADAQCEEIKRELRAISDEMKSLVIPPTPAEPGGSTKPIILESGKFKRLQVRQKALSAKLEEAGCPLDPLPPTVESPQHGRVIRG